MGQEPIIKLSGINKSFPGVKALSDISVEFYPGEVHALLGENGAGKSTLIKIIAGVYQADTGSLKVHGKEVCFKNPREGLANGISVIHQELSVIPDLTVAENIFLGREPKLSSGLLDRKKMNTEAQGILDSIGVHIKAKSVIRNLNNADKQMVEIARAVSQDSSVVIMDEPTSSLSQHEVDALFTVIQKLKKNNVSIIYISHRLKEITAICDRISVLRDGTLIKTAPLSEITEDDMITLMVGRQMTQFYYRPDSDKVQDDVVLKVENLTREGVFQDVSFDLHQGEILGVAGLIGAGRTEVMRAVFGADEYNSGKVTVFGKEVHFKSPREAIHVGLGLIPEDRRGQGLLLAKSVRQNTSLASIYDNSNHGVIDEKWEAKVAKEYIELLHTKTPSEMSLVQNLSGGNQQKVVIAKWLVAKSKILIMDEPTRGIDVNAKAEIYLLMKEFVENGGSIIMVSSEMPEVLGVSNRIMVMSEGRVSGFLDNKDIAEKDIMKLASINAG